MTFSYIDQRFSDIQMLRYRVSGFEFLSPQQHRFIYYLAEAALAGRDILWDQNCRFNLPVRRMLEAVYTQYQGDRTSPDFQAFLTYLRRVWFANGIHHHYGCDKFTPEFSEAWLRNVLAQIDYPIDEQLITVMFDPTIMAKRVNQTTDEDLLQTSACNYYAPEITQQMAEDYYNSIVDASDPEPIMYGLNSRLEVQNSQIIESVYRVGGLYGTAISKICYWLQLAIQEAENDSQREVLRTLIEFYHTGDLHTFDRYTIQWLQCTAGDIDFTNGFTEVYGDPLGIKASWEGFVNFRDNKASERTLRLSENAQWFEDHSPVDARFKKAECRGINAKVIVAATLGGDLYPASAIGINLPNSNWIRQTYGSKSVTIGNLTYAYKQAAKGNSFLEEFVLDATTLEMLHRYDDACDDLHTDLHECLGHGSGQLLPNVSPDALKSYGSTIEEARADLFALYYIADPKMLELALVPDLDAWKAQYYSYMLNGLMTQLVRIEPGKEIEEAHMRNRALIAHWLLAHYGGAMELVQQSNNTYLKIHDYELLRQGVGQLLAEVQRIKSEGDLQAATILVEQYGVKVDVTLHQEMLRRYKTLDIAPYKGFINPRVCPIYKDGVLVDATIEYGESYDEQMLRYSRDYGCLE
ncbi:MAG: dihydrofolate reductase [Bacteroidaceae bacterium]|nr:dihydrofolate reductase [Bacteroidaceae bacterium]